MKVKTLFVLAGMSAPLILSGSAGGFTGIKTESKPNEFGLFVCNVYATFGRLGEDHMLVAGGTPLAPLSIDVIGGTFFQAPPQFDSDRPPNPVHFDLSPINRYDSFVTIGVKSFNPADPGNPEGEPEDNMILTVSWPGFGASTVSTISSAWALASPEPQGDPFNPDFSTGGNGQVLIAQLATADGTGFEGTMYVQYISNGVVQNQGVSFQHLKPPCPWDCQPVPNGFVDIGDLFELFGQWTQVGGSCDFNSNGAFIDDLFEMFGNWGPCP